MNATVNVLLFKSKTLSNGEHPLMIRVCKDGKKKYQSLGISIHPQFWDFEKNKPKRHCPNKELIQRLINDKISELSDRILELKAEDKDFTATNLIKQNKQSAKKYTVQDLFKSHISTLEQQNRRKYASTFKELERSLIGFNGHLDIYFSDIDIEWLRGYENYLKFNGLKLNSIGIRMRTLRVLCNKALDDGVIKAEQYPFKNYKVAKLSEETVKRSITKEDIEKVIAYKTDNKYTQLAIDLFYFSYLCAGINFKDMAFLTRENIIENRLVYVRKKTKKLIKIPIQAKALDIINKYSRGNGKYLFPILADFHKTDIQQINRLNKVLKIINKRLKAIGKELNLPIDLTTYVARHSFATVLKRSGVSTSIISESLGHSSEKVTQYYLDSFENSQIDEAMKNLL